MTNKLVIGAWNKNLTPTEKFMRFVFPEANSGCWLWVGSCARNGYGWFSLDGERHVASRFAIQHFKGLDPTGLYVRHKCDNPPCVNPDHLELGTPTDNVADMHKRGRCRAPHSDGHVAAALTNEQVSEIKSKLNNYTWGLCTRLAKEYGVGTTTINSIRHGKYWKKVT